MFNLQNEEKRINLYFVLSNTFSRGGIARVSNLITSEIAKDDNFKVRIISFTNACSLNYPLNRNIELKTLNFKEFRLRRDYFSAIQRLKKVIDIDERAIVIMEEIGLASIGYFAFKGHKNIKLLAWTHMTFFNGTSYGLGQLGKIIAKKHFEKIIVLTKEDKIYYEDNLKATNVYQIYNPTNPNVVYKPYNITSKKIISVGRLTKIKGFDRLIDVAALVLKDNPEWTWDIYGEGDDKEYLNNKILEKSLGGKVILKGFSPNILDLYNNYAINVFTSKQEGCPMAMVEAMQAGLPIISFNFKCGPKDLIRDNINGYIIDNYDIYAMSKVLQRLIDSVSLRQSLSNGSQSMLDELQIDFVINKWKDLFYEQNEY